MWKSVSEIPSWNDFPIIAVHDGDGCAKMMIIDEASEVQDMPDVLFYLPKPWNLVCRWYGLVAWKSLEFQKVNEQAGCYVNTDPHMTWT